MPPLQIGSSVFVGHCPILFGIDDCDRSDVEADVEADVGGRLNHPRNLLRTRSRNAHLATSGCVAKLGDEPAFAFVLPRAWEASLG
jgi:hypothetical protein